HTHRFEVTDLLDVGPDRRAGGIHERSRPVQHSLDLTRAPLEVLGCRRDGGQDVEGVVAMTDLPQRRPRTLARDQDLLVPVGGLGGRDRLCADERSADKRERSDEENNEGFLGHGCPEVA
ncbi:MAG: hypothetical protein ACK559_03800, partial [bacterium]